MSKVQDCQNVMLVKDETGKICHNKMGFCEEKAQVYKGCNNSFKLDLGEKLRILEHAKNNLENQISELINVNILISQVSFIT